MPASSRRSTRPRQHDLLAASPAPHDRVQEVPGQDQLARGRARFGGELVAGMRANRDWPRAVSAPPLRSIIDTRTSPAGAPEAPAMNTCLPSSPSRNGLPCSSSPTSSAARLTSRGSAGMSGAATTCRTASPAPRPRRRRRGGPWRSRPGGGRAIPSTSRGLPHGRRWAELSLSGAVRRGPPTVGRAVGLRAVDGMAMAAGASYGVSSASSARTRWSMSSRMGRIWSRVLPAGSVRSQSR